MQNFAAGGAGASQDGQRRSSSEPQDMQNFASGGLAAPQLLHVLSIGPSNECTTGPVGVHSDLNHTLRQ
jgi:hypothetical protein